jgi:hypothetical protein
MAIRPDDLTRNQVKQIIDGYDAQPNASLDPAIRASLRDYKQANNQLNSIELEIKSQNEAMNLAVENFKRDIKRLERNANVRNKKIDVAEDDIIERHYELNGVTPPLDVVATPVVASNKKSKKLVTEQVV